MATFEPALHFMLKHEGGFVDHPNDPGGATNHGVSLRSLLQMGDEALIHFDVDRDGDLDVDDIRAMPQRLAIAHYRRQYWNARYEAIVVQATATKVFDMAVNMGPRQAIKILQRAVNWYGQRLTVDGIFGPQTLAATNAAGIQRMFQETLRAEHAKFYYTLLDQEPKRQVFILGWLRRAYS